MALFTVRVFVTLKPSVFDPQGRTIVESLHSMGYPAVSDVRQGKYFEVQVDAADPAAAEALVREVSTKLLANPVIESFRLESPAPVR
jgi:phosphoribosylformylglycinamidine synthase